MGHNHPTIRTFMAITAERDAAIRERNMALEETKRAFAELDMAMLQRDAAMAERNAAIQERDEAITSLRFQDNSMNYTFADLHAAKPRRGRQKSQKVSKRMGEGEVSNRVIDSIEFESDEDDVEKVEDDSGLNRISFDESAAMAVPVCTCTGSPQPCYRWGNGGWQSACCTTTISMYPLPQMANKRYSRVGGRKMSGGAFGKLVSRLGSEGYDFSGPLDLKDHWSKHGTNRYTTLK